GIGGVLLTPALVYLAGRDIHESVSLSLASFVLAGVVAAMRVAHARLRVGDWIFLAAIIPPALVGVLLAPAIPKAALSLIVSACVAFAGFSSLRKPSGKGDSTIAPGTLGGLGAVRLSVGDQWDRRPADLSATVALEGHGRASCVAACPSGAASRRRDCNTR